MKILRRLLSIALLFSGFGAINAQNALFVPDTLSGTNITLNMNRDSVQFLPGNKTQTLGFNGYKYFGPTLILHNGQQINFTVNNNIGDTTTVHWHGLHIAAVNDGGPHSMIMNGTSWSPQFTVMNNAATYWYHPHLDGKTGLQALRGAAGVIIVRDSIEAALNLPRTYGIDDLPLVVQSQEFDQSNQINPRAMNDSVLLVNGTLNPFVNLPAQVVRLRLLNASQERTFNFGFNNSKNFSVIGNDGGLLNAPVSTTRISVSPGERAEVLVDFAGMNGQTVYLMSYGSELPSDVRGGAPMQMDSGNTMYSPFDGADFNILKIQIGASTLNAVTSMPTSLVTVPHLSASSSNQTRTINFTAANMMVMDGPFYFNDSLFNMDRIDYHIHLNNTEIWTLNDQTMVAHPFHLHGMQFQILDRDGNAPSPKEAGWKDVVLVHNMETVRIIAKFTDFPDPVTPYMFHCHILMHEDDGMMGQYVIDDVSNSIAEVNNGNLKIYPNPVSEMFTLRISDSGDFEVNIFNAIGAKVLSTAISSEGQINVENLPSGTYFIRLTSHNRIFNSRFIKE